MMDHPNIAKVLDAGTTDLGRPFFVMELVRGIKITDYCDQANLTTKERLDLFIKVCQAIQHAHQKGIIHRDIKPSNILVTLHDGLPVPKVIDFGIAKATEGRLTDHTVYTQLHQFIGTPAYMSPEQAEMSGLDIDTRSDIYSLGVLLYELLVGSTPFDGQELMASGLDAMRKTIREKEPQRPSTKLSQTLVAANVSSLKSSATGKPTTEEEIRADSRRLLRIKEALPLIRGDLDWIVMKCLEKDRTRRYETSNGLAADLTRHLTNEPVLARPPSTAYRFQKLVRRNKLAFAAAACVASVLVLATIVSTWQAVRARQAKRAAESEKQNARNAERIATTESALAHEQRQRANAAAFAAQQNLYEADMLLAHRAIDEGNPGLTLNLLNKHRPGTGDPDLRGWEWRYLWGLCQSDEVGIFATNANCISKLAMSRDGTILAMAELRGAVKIWEYPSGRLLDIPESENAYGGVALSPDGKLLAFPTRKRGISLWDIPRRREITNFPGIYGNQWQSPLQFSPDGRILAAGRPTPGAGWDWDKGEILLWDVQTKTLLKTLKGQPGFIWAFAFSADSATLATAGQDSTIVLWSLARGLEIARFAPVRSQKVGAVTSLAFSPDGTTLASGTFSGAIEIWDIGSKRQVAVLTNHSHIVPSLAFSPDQTLLASGSCDHLLKLWDTTRWQEVSTLKGSPDEIWAIRFSTDGKTLISGGKDGALRTWNATPKSRKPDSLIQPPGVQRWDLRGGILFCTHTNGTISYWNAATLRRITSYAWPEEHRTNSLADDFTPSGKLAWANKQGEIVVWDLAAERQIARVKWIPSDEKVLRFSPDERLLAGIASQKERLTIWDLEHDGQEIATLPKSPDPVFNSMNFSRDGRQLAAGTWDGKVEVWNLLRKERTAIWRAHQYPPTDVSFLPDGKKLVTVSTDATAKLWEVETQQPLKTFIKTRNAFIALTIAPDGQRIAAGTDDGFIRIWNETTGREVATLKCGVPHEGFSLQFSPTDGNTLVSLTSRELRIWRAPSWDEINAAEANDKSEFKQP